MKKPPGRQRHPAPLPRSGSCRSSRRVLDFPTFMDPNLSSLVGLSLHEPFYKSILYSPGLDSRCMSFFNYLLCYRLTQCREYLVSNQRGYLPTLGTYIGANERTEQQPRTRHPIMLERLAGCLQKPSVAAIVCVLRGSTAGQKRAAIRSAVHATRSSVKCQGLLEGFEKEAMLATSWSPLLARGHIWCSVCVCVWYMTMRPIRSPILSPVPDIWIRRWRGLA